MTDRDICCRAVADGMDVNTTRVSQVMTSPVVTITPDAPMEECCNLMEQNMIRRVVVMDETGCCCGIVSQSDIARTGDARMASEMLQEVSRPTRSAPRVGETSGC